MRAGNFHVESSLRDFNATSSYSVVCFLFVLVFLGGHGSTSMAHSDDQPTAKELSPTEESEDLESEISGEPSKEGDGENGDESTSGQPDSTPAIDDSDLTGSESKTGEEITNDNDTEPITNVVILVQGNERDLKPIRGAEVFVSIKDHDDVQTSTNAKGLANISLPSGRVKIQVTAKDWKTFGEFYHLKGQREEIQITLESRKPGNQ